MCYIIIVHSDVLHAGFLESSCDVATTELPLLRRTWSRGTVLPVVRTMVPVPVVSEIRDPTRPYCIGTPVESWYWYSSIVPVLIHSSEECMKKMEAILPHKTRNSHDCMGSVIHEFMSRPL